MKHSFTFMLMLALATAFSTTSCDKKDVEIPAERYNTIEILTAGKAVVVATNSEGVIVDSVVVPEGQRYTMSDPINTFKVTVEVLEGNQVRMSHFTQEVRGSKGATYSYPKGTWKQY